MPKIFAAIVLHKTLILDSSTCNSMKLQNGFDARNVSILVYDNSPIENAGGLEPNWAYMSDPGNGGLAAAYNYALAQAKHCGAEWLLLFDQDSILPVDFLANLQNDIELCHENEKIVAIVPIVFCGQRQISPVRPLLGLDLPYKEIQTVYPSWLTAINSAAAIRVSFLDSIGGFSKDFWLDYLDHWLFRKIYDTNHSVYLSNMKIDHDLSVTNFNNGLELSRYKNILRAETAFTNMCLPLYWRPLLVFRLIARAAKHAVFTHDKRMALLMLSTAWRQALSILD